MLFLNFGPKNGNIDSQFDRYSRLFLSNICLVMSAILIIQYFTTPMHCATNKKKHQKLQSYILKNCWSSGLYIYQELSSQHDDAYYYGIPLDTAHDGLNSFNETCATRSLFSAVKVKDCVPMRRIYYSHYQWLPFYVGLLAIIYYLPFVVFNMNNADLRGLRAIIDSHVNGKAEQIVNTYFNHVINPLLKLRLKVWINICGKLLYVVVNVFAYSYTGYLMNAGFRTYGDDVRNWDGGNQTQTERLSYPGFKLLPPSGLCEFRHLVRAPRNYIQNDVIHCIMPANIMYQYALLLLWFLFVIGIALSVIGFFTNIVSHLYNFLCYGHEESVRRLCSLISLREVEYLDFLKENDLVLFGNVLCKLKETRGGYLQETSGGEDELPMVNSF